MSTIALSPLCVLPNSILTDYYSHFANEETQAQSNDLTYPRLHRDLPSPLLGLAVPSSALYALTVPGSMEFPACPHVPVLCPKLPRGSSA